MMTTIYTEGWTTDQYPRIFWEGPGGCNPLQVASIPADIKLPNGKIVRAYDIIYLGLTGNGKHRWMGFTDKGE